MFKVYTWTIRLSCLFIIIGTLLIDWRVAVIFGIGMFLGIVLAIAHFVVAVAQSLETENV